MSVLDGPGEGTWSVFAMKVVEERDEALARCGTLRELADQAAAEQGLAQRRMMEAQKERDEARAEVERLHARIEHIAASHVESLRLSVEAARREGAEAMRELAEANADVLQHKEERLRLRSALLKAEKGRDECLRALRGLLLSRDSAWKCGHDWQEAVDEAVSVYEKHGPKGI